MHKNSFFNKLNLNINKQNNRGITLLALVITIIVLLILASVSISMLTGSNGILTQVQNAKTETKAKSEEEAIRMSITSNNMQNYIDNSSNTNMIGKNLYDKVLSNGDKWNIVVVNNKTYGTGWNFIEKNTAIENYGTTENAWLANYQTGELIKLEDNQYTNLSYESGLATTDGLIFNMDALNMSDSSSWGDGVHLYGFDDEDEQGGYKGNYFEFDGVNDYITVDGNLNVEDEITLEFYGSINQPYETTFFYVPFFSAYNGINCMRMWCTYKTNLCTNFGYKSCNNESIWESSIAPHTLLVKQDIEFNKDMMVTATYNHNTQTYSIYSNGTLLKNAILDQSYWENFKNNEVPKIQYFSIGTLTWNEIKGYFNGKVYSIRIYNKALDANQVQENYNKAVAYHNITT